MSLVQSSRYEIFKAEFETTEKFHGFHSLGHLIMMPKTYVPPLDPKFFFKVWRTFSFNLHLKFLEQRIYEFGSCDILWYQRVLSLHWPIYCMVTSKKIPQILYKTIEIFNILQFCCLTVLSDVKEYHFKFKH